MKSFMRILAYARPYMGYALLNAISNFLLIFFSLASVGVLVPALDLLFGQSERIYEPVAFGWNKEAISDYASYHITVWVEQYSELTALAYICIISGIMFFFKNLGV